MSDRISRTRWGGARTGIFDPKGYFSVAENDGIFWLVDPDGGRFLSKGVNTVCFDQDHVRDTRAPRTPKPARVNMAARPPGGRLRARVLRIGGSTHLVAGQIKASQTRDRPGLQ